jgi:glycosyltransferase involved in cell wall biosynthesis
MRVLFASTRLSGGAGIACRRIWEALREQNKVSKATLVYREKADLWVREYNKNTGQTIAQEVYKHGNEWADEKLSKCFNEERSDFSATYLSALELESPYDAALIELFDAHDIVNMHWTSGLLSAKSLQYLKETNKPVLITLHDQRYFTGACHYSAGCRLFAKICSGCPQLATRRTQLLAEQQHLIQHAILSAPNFYWTGPSAWIIKQAASSGVPHSIDHVLPSLKNPVVDDAICTPDEVESIASKFRTRKRKVALVADDLNDPRKGSLIGVKALAMAVANSKHLHEGIELHLAGATEGSETIIRDLINQFNHIGAVQPLISVVSHGRVPSHHLAVILRLVDLLVFPSIEENYSNLLIETLGQGTTIVAFAVGGNREIAGAYPELMKVVGDRLNIANGFNAHDKSRLSHATRLLSRVIKKQLTHVASPPDEISEADRCRQNHSRAGVAESYLLAMQAILDAHSHSVANTSAHTHPTMPKHLQQSRVSCNGNRRRVVNNIEPVFWLGTQNDWPIQVADDQLLLMLALQPSWDENFLSSRLDSVHWSWNQFIAFKNDSYQVPELQYWDLVAVIGSSRWQSIDCSSQLLLPIAESENAVPVLLQAVVTIPTRKEITWNTISDLLWQAICGECIVSPMQGMSHFPSVTHFVQSIDFDTIMKERPVPRPCIPLSTIDHESINVEEPVFWLGRHTFNDLSLKPEQVLVGSALYPSWEPGYLQKIFSGHAEVVVLHEVLHSESDLPELRYWNTIMFRISSSTSCYLFSEETDEVHGFPVLYMGHGHRSAISSLLSLKELACIVKALNTVIPPMAGFHQIASSLH